jgi:hypothetical protein
MSPACLLVKPPGWRYHLRTRRVRLWDGGADEGIRVVRGDAKRRDVLAQAGIQRARGICVLIDNDADNLNIAITARSLNPRSKIISDVPPLERGTPTIGASIPR